MILFHVCCAICLSKSLAGYRKEIGLDPAKAGDLPAKGFFYNPNIHLLLEFRRRIKALSVYQERDPFPVEIDNEYGLTYFLDRIATGEQGRWGSPIRCAKCFAMRLQKTAEKAKAEGYEAFTTTLCASREQNRDLLYVIGQQVAEQVGIPFLWRDWRNEEPPSRWMNGVYRQQYCGCVFSEFDRYKGTGKWV